MDDTLAAVESAFRTTTLAELLGEETHSYPLCESHHTKLKSIIQQ
jgi:hypothetical protein